MTLSFGNGFFLQNYSIFFQVKAEDQALYIAIPQKNVTF